MISFKRAVRARALYGTGISIGEVAKAGGVHPQTITKAIRRIGGRIRTPVEQIRAMLTIPIAGVRFGRLVAIEATGERRCRSDLWRFQCDCGATVIKRRADVLSGRTRSCGCLQSELVSQTKSKDMTGQKFGRLTPLKRAGTRWGMALWLCQCDCGKQSVHPGAMLRNGHTRSCGCLSYGGTDSMGQLLAGEFRAIDAVGEFYIYTLANHPGLLKAGIDTTGKRADEEYGEQLLSIEGNRPELWVLEQGVLHQTRLLATVPPGLEQWQGRSEIRRMEPDHLINIATQLHQELLEMGLWAFAAQYMPINRDEREECLKRAS